MEGQVALELGLDRLTVKRHWEARCNARWADGC